MNRRKNYRKLSRRCKNRVLAGMLSAVLTLGVCVPECKMPVQAAELSESYGEAAYEEAAYEAIAYAQEENASSEESSASWDAGDVTDNLVTVMSLDSAEDDIAGGTFSSTLSDITWRIDSEGTLTVEGTGECGYHGGFDRTPWSKYSAQIKTAVIRVTGLKNASYMFSYCRNLTSVDVSGLDTSSVTNMEGMFKGCNSLTSVDVSKFDTSNVTNMDAMFEGCSKLEKLDVSGFDTSRVTRMYYMFENCKSLTGLDVSKWNTSSATGMSYMFYNCSSLTSLDVSGWDTSSMIGMSHAFYGCKGLTSLDVSGFETSNVTNMTYMFHGCSNLARLDVSGFDTGGVTDMSFMFAYCSKLTTLDTGDFKTGSVTNMRHMFIDCSSLTSLDASGFDTGSVTDMEQMFEGCSGLTELEVGGFDTGSVTNMDRMFFKCSGVTILDVSGFKTGSVTNMREMFRNCKSLGILDVSGFDTGSVTNMSRMFSGCSSLESLDVSGFDTGSVTDMGMMFWGCSGLTSLDVSGWDTGNATDMDSMFSHCSSLTSLDASGFDTGSVTDMGAMLSYCSSLTGIDVSGFDTSSVTDIGGMFSHDSGLTSLDLSRFDTGSVIDMDFMFDGCSGLTSLDLSGFDTGSLLHARGMFRDCSKLTSLDLSGFAIGRSSYDMGWMFDGCYSLTTIYTPYSLPESGYVEQCAYMPGGDWYSADGTKWHKLPEGLGYSIILTRDKTPDVAMTSKLTVWLTKSVYEPGSRLQPEDLKVRYRGTDGRSTMLSPKGDGVDTGYTMSDVDMNTPGEKSLTISYDDGAQAYTESVTFRIPSLLTDAMVTLSEGEYVYNGEAQEPVPVVRFVAGGAALTPGTDYTVSYENNTDAGEATLSVKGINTYSGMVSKTFTIQKAPVQDIEVTFSEWCWEAHENRTQDLSGYFDGMAEDGGIIAYTIGKVVEHDEVADGAGSVLSGNPSIDEAGILTYSTNPGTAGDTVLIPVTVTFARNYQDALLQVTVRLKDKTTAEISGITMRDAAYNGSPVTPWGDVAVRADDGVEGGEGTDITELVTLAYRYTGTQADGTAYDSDAAPTHAGSYILSVTVAENDTYMGSAEYPFVIRKAPLTITAPNGLVC